MSFNLKLLHHPHGNLIVSPLHTVRDGNGADSDIGAVDMSSPSTHELLIRAYHERTKHLPGRYADSLGYMDWANQPVPFRRYDGASKISLPINTKDPTAAHAALYQSNSCLPSPFTRTSIAGFLSLSLGLSAWKSMGGNQWALRINPSSGNLHPTECYLVLPDIRDVAPSVVHYNPYEHALSIRTELPSAVAGDTLDHFGGDGFGVVLTSVVWREAWKYGERAFRYTQHDVGHALAALRFSANLHGWRLTLMGEAGDRDVARLIGLDKVSWHPDEQEHVDLMAWVHPDGVAAPAGGIGQIASRYSKLTFVGIPNRLSRETVHWEILEKAASACEKYKTPLSEAATPSRPPVDFPESPETAATIVRKRRSAQVFDGTTVLSRESFLSMLDRTVPRPDTAPFDVGSLNTNVDLALFVHRVEDIEPGLYWFSREDTLTADLRQSMRDSFQWKRVSNRVPLYLLKPGEVETLAARLSCGQDIAGDSAFSLGMIARFDQNLKNAPWVYSLLFRETGMIGQVLYLESEAHGFRGTGIGCYFDDLVHELLGINGTTFQSLYHFTVGAPVDDSRLLTYAPYYHLSGKQDNGISS